MVLPVDGKLKGVLIPANVAWKPLKPVELLKVYDMVVTGQPQMAGLLASAWPLVFKSYVASALADVLVEE